MTRILSQASLPLLALAVLLQVGCASKKTLLPPRFDLESCGTIGMIQLDANVDPVLEKHLSSQLLQAMQQAQPRVRVVELGRQKQVLRAIGKSELDLEALRAIGDKYGVDSVLTGHMSFTKVKPSMRVSRTLTSLKLQANIRGLLEARIQETKSSATLWTRSTRASRAIARANASSGGVYDLGVSDKEETQAALTQTLVVRLTDDFRAHWVK